MRHMALLVFGVIFVSKDDNGYRWQKKQKKRVPEEEFTCCFSFTTDFYLMHSIGLIFAYY